MSMMYIKSGAGYHNKDRSFLQNERMFYVPFNSLLGYTGTYEGIKM